MTDLAGLSSVLGAWYDFRDLNNLQRLIHRVDRGMGSGLAGVESSPACSERWAFLV